MTETTKTINIKVELHCVNDEVRLVTSIRNWKEEWREVSTLIRTGNIANIDVYVNDGLQLHYIQYEKE